MPAPYLMLSLSIDPTHPDAATVANLVRQRLNLRNHARVDAGAVVVQVPNPSALNSVLADMTHINQAFDPCFSCVAVLVPFQQFCFASDRPTNMADVVAITGRVPA